jgi:beta-glucosidase
MKKYLAILLGLFLGTIGSAQTIDQKVNSLLKKMTLEEKVGQLNQYTGFQFVTGPQNPNSAEILKEIKDGKVGSMLNVMGTKETTQFQKLAMQTRLKIPLLFGLDVIHGYKTTFPIPLAESCSWDLAMMEKAARVAATEASASGIHWTFAPMVDIARDARWGRIMEGAGEDTFLGSEIAKARIKGFQGEKLGELNTVMACAKHFAAYGAATGGRDYNSVDMSKRMLWETYLPPFKASVDAGAATFMNSFNDLNGIPATGNAYLQRDILKGKWNYQGFVVSDWGSIGEMINHGFVTDNKQAAEVAIKAGSDMDMESRSYINNLKNLVEEGKVPMSLIDDAVSRILRKKFEMGLFDDPFRFSNQKREDAALRNPEHTKSAKEMAEKSIILLKNDHQTLPLKKDIKTVALIGPMGKLKRANHGFWAVDVTNSTGIDSTYIVSQFEGLQNKLGKNTKLLYAKGCNILSEDKSGFAEAIETAKQADVLILTLGERHDMSGEAKSRSNIRFPGVQEDLMKEIKKLGKPTVLLVNAGRPLIMEEAEKNADAILYTWWLGSEAGNAIADVLFGEYNPSAKTTVTFPRSEGQIPIYYNHYSTGRPVVNEKEILYKSAYIDLPTTPKYPFGYGLSYTKFGYSNLVLDKKKMKFSDTLEVSATITNNGDYDGEEIVQLYLHDKFGAVVRPVKELKDFQKIFLKKGESKTIKFIINKEKLSFYNDDLQWIAEPGDFEVMIGASSEDIKLKDEFTLE